MRTGDDRAAILLPTLGSQLRGRTRQRFTSQSHSADRLASALSNTSLRTSPTLPADAKATSVPHVCLESAGVRDQTSNAPSSRWKAATTASSRSSILKVTPTLSFAAAAHLITPRSPSRRHSLLRPLGCVAPSFCASALAVSLPHLSAAAPLARSCPVFTTTPEARAVRAFQSRDASLCCELRPHRDGDAVEAAGWTAP